MITYILNLFDLMCTMYVMFIFTVVIGFYFGTQRAFEDKK